MADIQTTAVDANGTPIVTMTVIDKETGTETPVNVSTCAEAVRCRQGIPMEQHLANLYSHSNDEGAHFTAEEKAGIETKAGAQAKATTAKNEAISVASLLVENAKSAAAADASEKATAARDASYKYTEQFGKSLDDHQLDTGNPHNVTAAQVGLGNVPNKSTNNLEPTYTAADVLTALTSGEKLSVAFGKIARAILDLISHIQNKSNPHGVTVAQIGAAASSHNHDSRYYTESEIDEKMDGKLSRDGGTMTGTLTMSGGHIVLKEGVNYGTELPAPGVKGRIFFRVVE